MTTIHDHSTPAGLAAWKAQTPGLYANVPFVAYLESKAVSRSGLMDVLNETLCHYRYNRDNPDRAASEAFLWGSAVHCRLQEPAEFERRYTRGPVNPKTGEQYGPTAKAWADAQAEADGFGLTLYSDKWCLDAMCAAILAHPDTRRILDGRPMIEATVLWRDKESGLLCKARPDNLNVTAGIFCDVKTTKSAHPHEFARAASDYGYFDQAAHYGNGLAAVIGSEFDCYLIPVEKAAPHAVGCYRVGGDDLEAAKARVGWALKQIAKAEKSGQWPGYRESDLYAPKWYLTSLELRQAREQGRAERAETEEPIFMGGSDDAAINY